MNDPLISKRLGEYRAQIDAIDDDILALLAKRLDCSMRISKEKHRLALPIPQPERYQRTRSKWQDSAQCHGIREDFALEIYELLHEESSRVQAQGDDAAKSKAP